MKAMAIVLEQPQQLSCRALDLSDPTEEDVLVDIAWSGISTGTEKLLWSGRMPAFPGMGYPLVPGYESVGHVREAGTRSGLHTGDCVFVPGSNCFGPVRGLFGGAAQRLVVPGARALPLADALGERGVLLALAATAYHVAGGAAEKQPELIIGHGVLGRLLARLAVLAGGTPTVWETNPQRHAGAIGYRVCEPAADTRRNYHRICDASGDSAMLDTLIGRLAPQGEIVLAGFYDTPLAFQFAPAFMREAHLRIAAQWQPQDLLAVRELAQTDSLSLHDLITHRANASDADRAYRTAFSDPACLKMILDWRTNP